MSERTLKWLRVIIIIIFCRTPGSTRRCRKIFLRTPAMTGTHVAPKVRHARSPSSSLAYAIPITTIINYTDVVSRITITTNRHGPSARREVPLPRGRSGDALSCNMVESGTTEKRIYIGKKKKFSTKNTGKKWNHLYNIVAREYATSPPTPRVGTYALLYC